MFNLTLDSLAAGHWHTLWTGHFLHFTFEHFFWDVLMFCVFTALLWREEKWRLLVWLAIAAPVISLFVFAWETQLTEYRGLSALDSILYTRFFLGLCMQSKGWERLLFGVIPLGTLIIKIAFEVLTGATWFVSDLGPGVVSLPSAHAAGMVLGAIWLGARCSRYSLKACIQSSCSA